MGMKVSKYVIEIWKDNNLILYNSLNRSVVVLEDAEKGNFINSLTEEEIASLKELNIILEDNIDEYRLYKYYTNSIKYNRKKLDVVIHLSYKCNLACTYCYQDEMKNAHEIISYDTLQQIYNLIEEEVLNNGITEVSLCYIGGEPLLHPEKIIFLEKKLTNLKQIKSSSLVVTNGSFLDKEMCEQLLKYNIKNYQITLDGPKEIHDKYRYITPKRGSYEDIMKNIKEIDKLCNIYLNVNLTEKTINSVPKLLNELSGIKLNLIFSSVFDSLGQCKSQQHADESSSYSWLKAHEYAMEKGYRFEPFYRDRKNACFYNTNASYIFSPEGRIYSCISAVGKKEFEIGAIKNIENESFHLMKSQFVEEEALNTECKECEILPICNGGCFYQKQVNKINNRGFICNKKEFNKKKKPLLEKILSLKIKEGNKIESY